MEDNIKQFLVKHNIKRFVAWGHKLHTHTHSYIHNGFILAFKHLGCPTLWLDKDDDISNIDFEGSLFVTEGDTSKNMPVLPSCYYILHNIGALTAFAGVPRSHILGMQVFTKGTLTQPNLIMLEPYIYYGGYGIFMPWATDLLPHEIDENIRKFDTIVPASPPEFNLVGMGTPVWEDAKQYCIQRGIRFQQIGGFTRTNVNVDDNVKLIQRSIIAPALQMGWQLENQYIPCRIFKNISYGKMGMSNNDAVVDLFNHNILFDPDAIRLVQMGLDFESQSAEYKKSKIIPLMEYVRDRHTYINRIHSIFHCFDLFSGEQ